MKVTKREIAHVELDTAWRNAYTAWTTYYESERALNAIPWGRTGVSKRAGERRTAVIRWAAARDTLREEYRKLKHLMRLAIQYKRL
ncbi:hypothetical protein LCGC14_0736130 [marine sediment metagenome]|uniref:Uncharacterized protein n=1 Tax=marine sediment metagenome TaxID=412755 RepID=A0A0F9ST21_9ZZZZ